MKLFQFNIGAKILLPVKIAFFVSILILLIIGGYFQNQQYMHETASLINFSKQNIKKNFSILSDIALQKAMDYSEREKVIRYYEDYYQTNNLDSVSQLLRKYISRTDNYRKKYSQYQHKTHFHLPPAISFCRAWTSQHGDNLQSFRRSILKVFETHKPQKGVEIGRSGFVIRGIAPVFDSNGKYLGSVEVFYNLSTLIDMSTQDQNIEFGLLVFLEKYDNILKLQNLKEENEYNKLNTRVILLDKTSNKFNEKLLKQSDILNELNRTKVYEQDTLLFSIFPLEDIGNEKIGYGICQVNVAEYQRDMKKLQIFIAVLVFVLLAISFVSILFVVKRLVTSQVNETGKALKNLSIGKVNNELKVKGKDEISEMKRALNRLNNRILELTDFANKIGERNFNVEFTPHSKDDVLGNALLEMRKGLLEAEKNAELIAIEEKQRNWATSGLAQFAELLRSNHENIEQLSESVISNLVRYTKVEQGAIYIVNDENPDKKFIELTAAFACNRKISTQQQSDIDEGLIGACYQEAETIFLTEIPNDYIKIVSGMGEAKPTSLLIVPLKHNEEVLGIVELAAFEKLPKYKIDFVEKVSESIAVALFNFKINLRTNKLLEEAKVKN